MVTDTAPHFDAVIVGAGFGGLPAYIQRCEAVVAGGYAGFSLGLS